jgi:ABC-type multidrug transport system fused ATPase/permease subunit
MISNLVFVVFDFIKTFAQLVIAFVNVAVWKWFAPLIVLVTSVPSLLIKNKQLKCEYDFQRNNMKYDRQMFYVTNISIDRNNAQDVKMFGLFPELKNKFYNIWNEMFVQKRKLVRKYTIFAMILDCVPQLVMIAFMLILGISVIEGNMNIQQYSYINGLISQLGTFVFSVIVAYSLVFDSKIRIKNYIKFMDMTEENDNKSGIDFKDTEFELEFKNVFFKYNDHSDYVLKGVNFKIRSDETYALVGVNGCGKTSIIKLILRFYDPTEGQILLNGRNVKEYSIDSVRRLFSPMFQNYNNYAFTVREDVYLSDIENKNDNERIIYSSVQSGADEFVRKFDNGYGAYLTRQYEDGIELSGGQWQKIAIARTIFRESLMYILDEPSSAIDAQSEDELFANFDKLFEHSGGILVSHRLSNVRKCDRIIVIDNGTVAEEGTHEQLMKNRKKYAHMFELQANKYQ